MKRIYVFSATGNGLMMSKEIAKGMGDTEIISIPKLMEEKEWSIEGTEVGFVFPCYYGTVPQIVKRFIKEAKTINVDYTYAVASAGGDTGFSLKHLNEVLTERGSGLDYGKNVIIASNYMNGWYYSMIMPKPEVIKEKIIEAKKLAVGIVIDIRNKEKSIEKPSTMGYIMPNIISPNRYIKDTRPWDSDFSVNSSCDQCGVCIKVCPVNNIEINETKHEFKHNCQRCMACIQYCPKAAFSIKDKAMNKTKFVNTEVKLKEMIELNN